MLPILKLDEAGYDFYTLLLDEGLIPEEFWIPMELVRLVGGINTALPTKATYELVLRIAELGNISFCLYEKEEIECLFMKKEIIIDDFEDFKSISYIVAKYSDRLIKRGLLNQLLENLVNFAESKPNKEIYLNILERYLSRGKEFKKILQKTGKILIVTGNDTCYGVLDSFSVSVAKAFEKSGYRVEFFNLDEQDFTEISKYENEVLKAVIGFQSYIFSIRLEKGGYFFDLISAPKFNFLFDSPISFSRHLDYRGENFYVVTHDYDYEEELTKFYRQKTILIPPGGNLVPIKAFKNRKYGVSFVGSYVDYKKILLRLNMLSVEKRELAEMLFDRLIQNSRLTLCEGLRQVLKEKKITLEEKDFISYLSEFQFIMYAGSYYLRERAINYLLENNIEVEVFGESFRNTRLSRFQNLRINKEVRGEAALEVYSNSIISLNFMTGHKAGFTERMANILLSGALLVSDYTRNREVCDIEMIVIDYDKLPELVLKIKQILTDKDIYEEIALEQREKALKNFTWEQRVVELLKTNLL